MARVRTNIEIEEDYVTRVMQLYGAKTKTEAVDIALKRAATMPMTKEEALAMHGANAIDIDLLPPDARPRHLDK